jgi:hypothetical protein
MGNGEFLGYVGDPDIHDGRIAAVQQMGHVAYVTIDAACGRRFTLEFQGVESLNSNRAEGMTLYALGEMDGCPPLRRFVFSNWNEDDDASLEIIAREIAVTPMS